MNKIAAIFIIGIGIVFLLFTILHFFNGFLNFFENFIWHPLSGGLVNGVVGISLSICFIASGLSLLFNNFIIRRIMSVLLLHFFYAIVLFSIVRPDVLIYFFALAAAITCYIKCQYFLGIKKVSQVSKIEYYFLGFAHFPLKIILLIIFVSCSFYFKLQNASDLIIAFGSFSIALPLWITFVSLLNRNSYRL